jgi:hypothetical protein
VEPRRGLAFVLAMVVVLVGSLRAVLVGRCVPVSGLFEGNQQIIRIPFVSEMLEVELADRLHGPAGTDPTPVQVVIEAGQTVPEIEASLVEQGLLTDRLAFQYLVASQRVDQLIQAGTFTMDRTMSPSQVVDRLKASPDPVTPRVLLSLREGLRIEQVVPSEARPEMDVKAFRYQPRPPNDLRDEYDFLKVTFRRTGGVHGRRRLQDPADITPDDHPPPSTIGRATSRRNSWAGVQADLDPMRSSRSCARRARR